MNAHPFFDVRRSWSRVWSCTLAPWCVVLAALAAGGCATTPGTSADEAPWAGAAPAAEPQRLREGDDIQIVFPSSPNLDVAQKIRPDGRINLFLVGEMLVAGMTPAELERELVRRYQGQITSNEVNVTVLSSSFTVLVGGAVLAPGKIRSERPLTLLEAIWEAGGFDLQNAKASAVVVMRNEEGRIRRYTVNVQDVLDGKSDDPFLLRADDMIYVPRKFSWL